MKPINVLILVALAIVPITATASAGPCAPGTAYDPACDVNHDGAVNVLDIQLTADHWNQSGPWVSDNNHTHLGQTWTGDNSALRLVGSYGAPDYAPLVISNTTNDGLTISSVGDNGVNVWSAGDSGLYVYSAGTDGVTVESVNNDGVFVGNAGDDGVHVGFAADNGVEIGSAINYGIEIGIAGNNGIQIWRAGHPSFWTPSYNPKNGFEVAGAQANGLYVGRADDTGVYVNSAGNNGVYVDSVNNNGVVVNSAVNNSGVFVGWAGYNGVSVWSAGNDGVSVNSASWDGVEVGAAGWNGVYAHTTQENGQWGFYTPDRIFGIIGMFSAVSLVAQVTGSGSLTVGDLVAVVGRAESLPASAAPLPLVRLADDTFTGIIGVVESRLALTSEPSRQVSAGETSVVPKVPQLRNTDGPAHAGDYVAVTVLGAAQVKVDSAATVEAGQRLTVSNQPGHARALRTVQVDGVTLDEGGPTLGVALEAAKDGLVWVMVNP